VAYEDGKMGRKRKRDNGSVSRVGSSQSTGRGPFPIPEEFQNMVNEQIRRAIMMGISIGINGMGFNGGMANGMVPFNTPFSLPAGISPFGVGALTGIFLNFLLLDVDNLAVKSVCGGRECRARE
jgi:hypothetical protein